jgi:hypothetical protein
MAAKGAPDRAAGATSGARPANSNALRRCRPLFGRSGCPHQSAPRTAMARVGHTTKASNTGIYSKPSTEEMTCRGCGLRWRPPAFYADANCPTHVLRRTQQSPGRVQQFHAANTHCRRRLRPLGSLRRDQNIGSVSCTGMKHLRRPRSPTLQTNPIHGKCSAVETPSGHADERR